MAVACRSNHLESSVNQPFAVGEFAGLPTSARLHDTRAKVRPHQVRIAMSGSTLAARRDTREGHRHPSSAVVAGGRVVLGGRDRMVHAPAAKTGKPLWTFTTRARVDSSTAIAGGRVFVGSNEARVHGLDLASGRTVWEYDAASPVTSSPAVAKGKVVVATADGQVICSG